MSTRRLLFVITTVMALTWSALSTGPAASALPSLKQITAVADEVASVLANRFGFSRSEATAQFVAQATKVTPVSDDVALRTLQREWTSFTPKKPPAGKVVTKLDDAPPPYRKPMQMLCETALDLYFTDDKVGWEFAMGQVNGQIAGLHPVGQRLALYSDLNEVVNNYLSGCYCAATAKLMVMVAKQTYC